MVTKEQAIVTREFHYAPRCELLTIVNENSHAHPKSRPTIERWRRNGQTQTWVTRPNDFKVPIKYGLRDYTYITQDNAHEFHRAEDCSYG